MSRGQVLSCHTCSQRHRGGWRGAVSRQSEGVPPSAGGFSVPSAACPVAGRHSGEQEPGRQEGSAPRDRVQLWLCFCLDSPLSPGLGCGRGLPATGQHAQRGAAKPPEGLLRAPCHSTEKIHRQNLPVNASKEAAGSVEPPATRGSRHISPGLPTWYAGRTVSP